MLPFFIWHHSKNKVVLIISVSKSTALIICSANLSNFAAEIQQKI